MRKFSLIIACLGAMSWANAQLIETGPSLPVKMTENAFFASFSPNGDYIVFSDAQFNGLNKLDLKTNSREVITTKRFAGYKPEISADGNTILFREASYSNNKRYVSLNTIQLNNKQTNTIVQPSRSLSAVGISGSRVLAGKDGKISRSRLESTVLSDTKSIVGIENKLMVIYTPNGKRSVIAPNGNEKSYYWASISPDGKKLVYGVAAADTWVCNIDGSNPISIGRVNAPKWVNNNIIVGMNETENGTTILSSEVIAVSADGQTRQILVPAFMMAMYPVVSPNGDKLIFNTPNGDLFIQSITIK